MQVECVQGATAANARDLSSLMTDAINKAVQSKFVLPNERRFTFEVMGGIQLHPKVLGLASGAATLAPEIQISALNHVTEKVCPCPQAPRSE
jgi:hypothetical protein